MTMELCSYMCRCTFLLVGTGSFFPYQSTFWMSLSINEPASLPRSVLSMMTTSKHPGSTCLIRVTGDSRARVHEEGASSKKP
jgi:hypothetical protein